MEILESHPLHGPAAHMWVDAGPRNWIGNRPESKHERLVRAFDVSRSQQPAPRDFFPYAIPLPHGGDGGGDWQHGTPWGIGDGGRDKKEVASRKKQPPPHGGHETEAGRNRRKAAPGSDVKRRWDEKVH
jgi:hypothetical protein